MKEIRLRLAALLLCLCLAAGAACGEAFDTSTVQELSLRIYEANRLETLLKNHESVLFLLNGESPETAEYYVYETAEGAYADWGGESAVYARGSLVYGVDRSMDMYFSPNLAEKPDPLAVCGFALSPDTAEEWQDPDHDHFAAWTLEKGCYHYRTRYDRTLSKDWLEANTDISYDGQTILTEAVADGERTEIISFTWYLEQDGETTELKTWRVLYDVPEPQSAAILRAAFERTSGRRVTLTFIVNPGSGEERKCTVTVPANSALRLAGAPAVFDDAEGTVPADPGAMEDHTFYVFTDRQQPAAGPETDNPVQDGK